MMGVESPCIQACILQDGVCVGCKRTSEEITNWRDMTDVERWQVLNRIFEDEGIEP